MTIHRLMTAMATEQGRLHGDEQLVETINRTTDDRCTATEGAPQTTRRLS
ncbi:MAG TPA: hypothetical protein VFI00_18350 [Kribbella sp.]|nr:hypothetical protein [Kribbella sp.]